jgi:enoyl-CoA hydratase
MPRRGKRVSDATASDYETVLYDVSDRVATVTLNRPESHNALNFPLRRDIVAALRRAEQDPEVSLVLLKGAGKSFCAGYDVKGGKGSASDADARRGHEGWVSDPGLEEWTDQFARSCIRDWMTLWDLFKPVVAQVHGNCLAGGLEVMSLADIVFVADDTRLGYPPMRGSSTPDMPVFVWKMSMAQAKYMQLTGNSITGQQAAEWGWVAKSFPADQLEAEVARELHVLRNIDTALLAANKMAVNQAYELMGMRTHLNMSWVWHHASSTRELPPEKHGIADESSSVRDALAWMNAAANEVGIL